MDSIKFINNYDYYLSEISSVVKSELLPLVEEMKGINPLDLIRPDTWFQSEMDVRGFVWGLFIKKALYNTEIKKFLI